jgi:hypothetical protein
MTRENRWCRIALTGLRRPVGEVAEHAAGDERQEQTEKSEAPEAHELQRRPASFHDRPLVR